MWWMIRALKGLSAATLIMQTTTPLVPGELGSLMAVAERLTLMGAMILALSVLWKTIVRKDELLLESARATQTALTLVADSNREIRQAISDLRLEISQTRDR